MAELAQAFTHPFLQRALLASLVVAAVCSIASFFVVLRRIAFVGSGVAHIAFGGVAMALLMGVPPVAGAALLAVAAAAWIALPHRRGGLSEDTAIGIAFAAAMALGVVCASLGRARNVDLMTFLFGNVLTVTWPDVVVVGALGTAVLLVFALLFPRLLFVSFDEETARIVRLPVDALNVLLFVLIALTVVLAMRTVGLLLVSALLVVPGAVAQRLTARLRPFLALSLAVAVASAVLGLGLSVLADLPSGATMVLVAAGIFLLASGRRRRPA